MTSPGLTTPGRAFGQLYAWMVLTHVEQELGATEVERLLLSAGETRTVQELLDPATWNSYEQIRRLMEACGRIFGGPQTVRFSPRATRERARALMSQAAQELASPERLFGHLSASMGGVTAVLTVEVEEVEPREWLLRHVLAAGLEPFEELCAFHAGLYGNMPWLYGFPDVDVVEVACQRSGDPACVFRIRWDDVDEQTRRVQLLETRTKVLEVRLEEFTRTVSELVIGSDLSTVLADTLASAARAVRARSMVLALEPATALSARTSYGVGVEDAEAAQLGAQLLAGSAPDSWLVVDVASTQRSYGHIAAIKTEEGFLAAERQVLQAYGSVAAIALDSATALEQIRRQDRTSRALLELSTSLAEISSLDEMAAKLVRAVPLVIDCDRTLVLQPDGETGLIKVAAAYGFSAQDELALAGMVRPTPSATRVVVEAIEPTRYQEGPRGGEMDRLGLTLALEIPIIVAEAWCGAIVVAVTSDPGRLYENADVKERLRGLAAQATTAIRNAQLLDQVSHQAFHDPLTDLPNRALILDRVEQMLVRARRHGRPAAAMFIDLDGFKEINDTFGHATGDHLLREVAARLKATLRASDTIGRLGGDEFVILLEGDVEDPSPEVVAERILSALRKPFATGPGQAPLVVTASVGVATGDRLNGGELLRDADIALYGAKAAGKDRFVTFEPAMQEVVRDRLLLQMDVQGALDNQEFFLVYQPIFALSTGQVTGVEALLRWQHGVRGELQPGHFIPLLEDSGRIIDVGRWVLEEACRQAAAWHADGLHLTMSVNVSARQLQNDEFVQHLRTALAVHGLKPGSLVVEITESVLMTGGRDAWRRLADIKAVGVRIAIDDFGTGYSSLAYLREFPVDTLKIDRSFVAALGGSKASTALVHTLVQLGRSLGMETIAEGIEEISQYEQLDAQHCDSGQGFLMARPMRPVALREFLTARAAAQLSREPAASH